jgi:predicted aminopeptidase
MANSFTLSSSIASLVLLLGGCQTIGYYAQAIGGQMELWHASQPIDVVLRDEGTDAELRERLVRVAEIRDFATGELALPDDGSYREYADLRRPYVVWNVFAAPEFSLTPREWCFPIAGCVAYRGYFSEDEAHAFAAGLEAQGLDVFVAGVPAYSTLGWFDDPVLNTFIAYPETEIARLVFHELAHRVAYVPGDTMFNESFATAVELAGVERWIKTNGTPEQAQAFQVAQARKQQFLDLTGRTRERLRRLYLSDLPEQARRAGKAEALRAMRDEHDALKQSWGGFAGYDRWFDEPLNNAKLVSIAAYSDLVPGFRRLLDEANGDMAQFYRAVKSLATLPRDERLTRLGAAGIGSQSRSER